MRRTILLGLVVLGLLSLPLVALAAMPTDFSIHYEFRNPDGSVAQTATNSLLGNTKYRIEMTRANGNSLALEIYRQDKGVVWSLDPESKTYTEQPLTATVPFVAQNNSGMTAEQLASSTKTGHAKMLDYDCDILSMEQYGSTHIFYYVRDLGIVLRWDVKQKDKVVQNMVATHLSLKPPDAALFEIPAGYTKAK